LGSGKAREGGGVPRRSRALALTALVAEKTDFFAFAICQSTSPEDSAYPRLDDGM